MKKIVFITAHLVPDPDVYRDKSNEDVEKEILKEMPIIPYVAKIEKVTVLDCEEQL